MRCLLRLLLHHVCLGAVVVQALSPSKGHLMSMKTLRGTNHSDIITIAHGVDLQLALSMSMKTMMSEAALYIDSLEEGPMWQRDLILAAWIFLGLFVLGMIVLMIVNCCYWPTQRKAGVTDKWDQDGGSSIESMIEERANFHEMRRRCVGFPDFAKATLNGYATLNIKVLKASGLVAGEKSWQLDPYVKVSIDDEEVFTTKAKYRTIEPEWNEDFSQGILNARSIVQLQVLDKDVSKISHDEMFGFVEFPVADLPFGEPIRGWFSLIPERLLSGTAPHRVARFLHKAGFEEEKPEKPEDSKETTEASEKSTENSEHSHGKILLQVQLDLQPGGESDDEWYSFCLGPPSFIHTYHLEHRELDIQAFYDSAMRLVDALLSGIINPVISYLVYVLMWREKLYTFFILVVCLVLCWRPSFILPVILVHLGVLLILTRNEARRKAMSAEPGSVALNHEGYELVAATMSVPNMVVFLKRVIHSMQGKVLDPYKLEQFAAFAFVRYLPVTAFEDLKKQLRANAQGKSKFLSFSDKPMEANTLVKRGMHLGEIECCINPKAEPGERRYRVRWSASVTGGSLNDYIEEVDGDSLEKRLDMRWMCKKAVLSVLPDDFRDLVGAIKSRLNVMSRHVADFALGCEDVLAWKNRRLAVKLTAIFFLSGVLIASILVLIEVFHAEWWLFVETAVGLTVGVLLSSLVLSLFFWSCTGGSSTWNRCRAYSLSREHRDKAAKSWALFSEELVHPPIQLGCLPRMACK